MPLCVPQNEVGRLNLAPDDTIEDRTTPEQGRIAFAEELRFMLPKHWTCVPPRAT